MVMDVKNKVIVLSAAYSPLGKAMAEVLCEHGASLALGGRNQTKGASLAAHLSKTGKGGVSFFNLDIASENSVKHFYQQVIRQYGKVDVVINNASFGETGTVHSQELTGFMDGMNGTINGVFLMTREILPFMMDQGYGNFINIASMYGVISPNPATYLHTGVPVNPASYGAGKAAVIQFTRYVACNYGNYHIRANAVSPGAFPTGQALENNQFMENLKQKSPLGRVGEPDDMKGIILYLASDASKFMTGQNICIDGGITAW